jgi:Mn-containing catalase
VNSLGTIFKPIIHNEGLYEVSNDNGVRVVNFATLKNLSRAQHSHTMIFINTLQSLNINSAWECIRENIKTSAKENIEYHRLKHNNHGLIMSAQN